MILSLELPDFRASKLEFHRIIACLIAAAPGTYSNVKMQLWTKNISASDHRLQNSFAQQGCCHNCPARATSRQNDAHANAVSSMEKAAWEPHFQYQAKGFLWRPLLSKHGVGYHVVMFNSAPGTLGLEHSLQIVWAWHSAGAMTVYLFRMQARKLLAFGNRPSGPHVSLEARFLYYTLLTIVDLHLHHMCWAHHKATHVGRLDELAKCLAVASDA